MSGTWPGVCRRDMRNWTAVRWRPGAPYHPDSNGCGSTRTARGRERADQIIVSSAQREQRELATFHLEQGRKLFDREQDREALAELRKAVYLSPYEAQAHLLIGRIHLRGGRPADAVDAFKISIGVRTTPRPTSIWPKRF